MRQLVPDDPAVVEDELPHAPALSFVYHLRRHYSLNPRIAL